jgi:hypothetical protein
MAFEAILPYCSGMFTRLTHPVKKCLLTALLTAAVGFVGAIFFSSSASASCITTWDLQNVRGEGVYETCGGDDWAYRVPLVDPVVFGGITYDDVYATTNSVVVFGFPDQTWMTYPPTPGISFQSNDWVPGVPGSGGFWPWSNSDEHFIITTTASGFVVDLAARPYYDYFGGEFIRNVLAFGRRADGTLEIQSFSSSSSGNYRNGCRLVPNGPIVDFETCGITPQVSLLAITQFVEQIANDEGPAGGGGAPEPEPGPPVVFEMVPDPEQQSRADSISGLSAIDETLVDITVNGNFIEKLRAIEVNGIKVPFGAWIQTSNSITFQTPKSETGTYEVQMYNGSVPVIERLTFKITG